MVLLLAKDQGKHQTRVAESKRVRSITFELGQDPETYEKSKHSVFLAFVSD
jgi:hypothetical protein